MRACAVIALVPRLEPCQPSPLQTGGFGMRIRMRLREWIVQESRGISPVPALLLLLRPAAMADKSVVMPIHSRFSPCSKRKSLASFCQSLV